MSDAYSGYLSVNEEKDLFYIFIESENDPTTDPILVEQQGGPGASSLTSFMMGLNGPLLFIPFSQSIMYNPYAWNKNASILYIESPAGVGFSPYRVTPEKRVYNDMIQSEDSYAALKSWYKKFPEYAPSGYNNSLFIIGMSYSGIFTPHLSW